MTTADLSLRYDPKFEKIARRYLNNPAEFQEALQKPGLSLPTGIWAPRSRYLGPEVPSEVFIWQDPIPKADYKLIDENDISALKAAIKSSGLTVSQLVKTAWASASTFRGSDKRGGANGARIQLAPQKDWEVNEPAELQIVLEAYKKIQAAFNAEQTEGKKVSLADLIVLGGIRGYRACGRKGRLQADRSFYSGQDRRCSGADRHCFLLCP